MATTKPKAEAFVRDIIKTESELLKKHGIERKDLTLRVSIDVTDRIGYHNHEDED